MGVSEEPACQISGADGVQILPVSIEGIVIMKMDTTEKEFIKGMDVSTLLELEQLGVKYFDAEGKERDLLALLQEYGVNAIRLRLWNDPYSRTKEPYGAGTNDLETAITLGERVKARGMEFLLNIHYSDFWADPQKQIKPKLWADFKEVRLEQAVYDYTRAILQRCRERGVFPDMIQLGNDLSNGFLWPDGKTPNFDNIALFISAGIRAVRTVDSKVPIMLHLDDGGNNMLHRNWFDNYFEHEGEDFQIIGLTYFPFRHGSLARLEQNMKDLARRYGKELMVAEVAASYSKEDYAQYEKLESKQRKGSLAEVKQWNCLEYPATRQGQADFLKDFMKRLRNMPNNQMRGFFYWEPGWIPVPGSGWATSASLHYLNDSGPVGNEWANQALFDYEGRPLPALEVIKNM